MSPFLFLLKPVYFDLDFFWGGHLAFGSNPSHYFQLCYANPFERGGAHKGGGGLQRFAMH